MPSQPTASLALQVAIVSALSADPELTALTGAAPRIFDDVPPSTPYPYLSIGQTIERDWSTGSEPGGEHTITLHAWSKVPGRREVHLIAGRVRDVLHDAALALTGHRLINLRHEFSDARREPDGETYHALIRFRAVTEPV